MVLRESDMTKINAKRKSPGRIWPDWYPVLATFRNSDNRKAAWQLINTVGGTLGTSIEILVYKEIKS